MTEVSSSFYNLSCTSNLSVVGKPSLRRMSEHVATWEAIDAITQLLSLTIPCGSPPTCDISGCICSYVHSEGQKTTFLFISSHSIEGERTVEFSLDE
jgi:hypothetical protein